MKYLLVFIVISSLVFILEGCLDKIFYDASLEQLIMGNIIIAFTYIMATVITTWIK